MIKKIFVMLFLRKLELFYDDIIGCFMNNYVFIHMWNFYDNLLINIE
jgi:hypothetical protein